MGVTLDALQALQQVQRKLTALQSKIDQKRSAIRTHERRLNALRRKLAEKHNEIQHQQSNIAQQELEVKTHEGEISKLREALNRSKTNKEYAAVLTQINMTKADTSKLEDRVLEMMGRLEQLRLEELEIKKQIEMEEKRQSNSEKAARAFEEDSRQELNALERHRAEAAENVPGDTLQVFERIAERHEGEVLARVLQPHPKRDEFICEGCNMAVTLEQFVSLKGIDQLQQCNTCGRVLYLDPSL